MNIKRTFGDMKNPDPTKKSYVVTYGDNMGNRTLGLDISIRDLMSISKVRNASTDGEGNDAQRPLDPNHAKGLATHILVGLMQTQILMYKQAKKDVETLVNLQKQLGNSEYAVLQPLVCNIQNCARNGDDLEIEDITEKLADGTSQTLTSVKRVYLGSQQILSVVDGQHRREGFRIVLEWLEKVVSERSYPLAGLFKPKDGLQKGKAIRFEILEFWEDILNLAFGYTHVKVECHLGLDIRGERQLFNDLNNKGKNVSKSLSNTYDRSDAVNCFVQEELKPNNINFNLLVIDKSNWAEDSGSMLEKDLNPITCMVMFGKTSSKTIKPYQVEERKSLAIKFWESVQKTSHFASKGSRTKTILAQPVVLKALAKLAFDLGYGKSGLKNEEHLAILWKKVLKGDLDFSHKNKHWRSLMLDSAARKKEFPGIENYIHVPLGTNLDAGTYDSTTGWVRYGSNHNDIYPRIGDLIRFQLGFDPRDTVKKAIKKDKEANK